MYVLSESTYVDFIFLSLLSYSRVCVGAAVRPQLQEGEKKLNLFDSIQLSNRLERAEWPATKKITLTAEDEWGNPVTSQDSVCAYLNGRLLGSTDGSSSGITLRNLLEKPLYSDVYQLSEAPSSSTLAEETGAESALEEQAQPGGGRRRKRTAEPKLPEFLASYLPGDFVKLDDGSIAVILETKTNALTISPFQEGCSDAAFSLSSLSLSLSLFTHSLPVFGD